MLRLRNHYLYLMPVIFMAMSGLLHAQLHDEEGTAKLEPFALTQVLVDELLQASTNAIPPNSFALKGLIIRLTNQTDTSVSLVVEPDIRLNLWRGRANDLGSSHGGTMSMSITAINDDRGTNIHNASGDARRADMVMIYRQKNGTFQGVRDANFKMASKESRLTQVSGKIQLSLPLNPTKYVVKTGTPDNTRALLARGDIKAANIVPDGIEINSPPDLPFTVMAFDAAGTRIPVTGTGTGGPIRWYRVNEGISIAEMQLFIPQKIVKLDIPFSIDVRGQIARFVFRP